jgi:hypothetical protein
MSTRFMRSQKVVKSIIWWHLTETKFPKIYIKKVGVQQNIPTYFLFIKLIFYPQNYTWNTKIPLGHT